MAAATALLIVVAVVVLLFTANLGFLKPQIEDFIIDASGRNFSIDGPLSVRLGRRAIVTADDVRWQNAAWADDPEMLQVGRFEIDVDLLSVVRGPPVIERVLVRDARVQLARNADNVSNWAVFETDPAEPAPSGPAPGLMLKQLDVADVDIRIIRPTRPALDIRIRSLRQDIGDDNVLSASLDAASNGRDLSVIARLETWTTLLERGRIDYELDARLDRVRLSSNGFIDSLSEPCRPDLQFALKGPAISDLFAMAGLGEHGVGDVNLDGFLRPADGGPVRLGIEGNLGQTTVKANGSFSDLQDLEQVNILTRANGPNLGRILGLLGIEQVSEAPFSLAADLEREGKSLVIRESTLDIGDAKLALRGELPEFPTLAGASAATRLEGPRIEQLRRILPIPDGMSGPFLVDAELDASAKRNEAFRLNARTSLGTLEASGSLGPAPNHLGSRARLRFEAESLADIGALWDMEYLAHVPVTLNGELELVENGLRTRDGLVAAIGEHSSNIEGAIGTEPGLRESDLSVRLSGKSFADLGRTLSAVDGLPAATYEIHANLRVDDAGYRLQNLTSRIGESNLLANGLISRRPDLAGSRVSASIRGPALEALVPAVGSHRIRPGPFSLSAEAAIENESIRFNRIRFEREFADIAAELELGWPWSFDSAGFTMRGTGRDIRALIGEIGGVELDALPYSVVVDGSRRGSAWTVDRLDLKLGDAEAHISGKLDYGDTQNPTRLTLGGAIPSLARLGTIDGRRLRDSPVGLHATVTSDDSRLTASDLRVDIDEGSIGGMVTWRPGKTPALDIALRSDYLTLHPVTSGETEEEVVEPHFDDGRLIPDFDTPFAVLEKIDASLRLDIGEFERKTLQLRDVALSASLRSGALTVHEFGFRGKSGEFQATARLAPAEGAGHLAMDMTADNLRLDLNTDDQYEGMIGDLVLRLESNGTSLRTLAGNSNGVFYLDARNGRLPNSRVLSAIYGNVLDEILATVNPFSGASEYTQLDCVVAPVKIVDGKMRSAPTTLVLTDKVQLMSQNTIDLETETIDLNFRTTPRKELGVSAGEIVNPYVKVIGTLAAPKLAVDRKGVMVAGGAAVATGGISVLARAAWDRLSKTDDPCGVAVAEAHKALAGRIDTRD